GTWSAGGGCVPFLAGAACGGAIGDRRNGVPVKLHSSNRRTFSLSVVAQGAQVPSPHVLSALPLREVDEKGRQRKNFRNIPLPDKHVYARFIVESAKRDAARERLEPHHRLEIATSAERNAPDPREIRIGEGDVRNTVAVEIGRDQPFHCVGEFRTKRRPLMGALRRYEHPLVGNDTCDLRLAAVVKIAEYQILPFEARSRVEFEGRSSAVRHPPV